ncbi:MAG: hypothetical protein AAFQ81_17045 [Pseudomonadota bacterium]
MILSETGAGPVPVPPLAEFKEHLRLAHGFADDGAEDAVLTRYLAAAVAVVERRVARALVRRGFTLSVARLERDGCVVLPIGPVTAVTSASLEGGGAPVSLDVSGWSVEPCGTRQRVTAGGGALPAIPAGRSMVLSFEAGLAADWAGVPAELAQAVMMLAADFHARRGTERDSEAGLPQAVIALTQAWRPGRL